MRFFKKVWGGLLFIVGFLLSPLSWWNDLFINIPLAYGFGWLVSLFAPNFFLSSIILGYWLSNILGLFLMHQGSQITTGKDANFSLKNQLLVATGYTLLIILLWFFGIIKLPSEYFS